MSKQYNTFMSAAINSVASEYDIPESIISAIVKVESNGNVFAHRVEPPYRYLVDVKTKKPFRKLTSLESKSETAPKDFPHIYNLSSKNTEWLGQQASWGPMQIMGAVAREYGFKEYFPALCSFADGLEYGCLHLSALRKRFLKKHGWEGVVAAYNAGSPRYLENGDFVNQDYIDKVIANGGFLF